MSEWIAYHISGADRLAPEVRGKLVESGKKIHDRTILLTGLPTEPPQCGEITVVVRKDTSSARLKKLLEDFILNLSGP